MRAIAHACPRRAFLDARIRTAAFRLLLRDLLLHSACRIQERLPDARRPGRLRRHLRRQRGAQIFFGYPYDIVTVTGYSAWRVGGSLAIAAAVLGVLASVRAMRAEEESGRLELVLSGPLTRAHALAGALTAIAGGIAVVFAAELLGSIAGGLPAGGSAYLALSTASVGCAFAGIGALAAQLAPTRRGALQIGLGVVAVMLLLRAVADTAAGAGWMRWLTPLGWAEEMRPFTAARPLVLLAPAALTALTLAASAWLAATRDIGTGLLRSRDDAKSRLRLLRSPTAAALRAELGTLAVWALSLAVFARRPRRRRLEHLERRDLERAAQGLRAARDWVDRQPDRLPRVRLPLLRRCGLRVRGNADRRSAPGGGGPAARDDARAAGRPHALACRTHRTRSCRIRAVRGDRRDRDVGGRDERRGGHLARELTRGRRELRAGGAALPRRRGVCLRCGAARERRIVYGLVAAAFLWYLVGGLLGAPHWLVELTPFAHIGFVPSESFRTGAALVMIAIGAVGAAGGLALLRGRDLVPA